MRKNLPVHYRGFTRCYKQRVCSINSLSPLVQRSSSRLSFGFLAVRLICPLVSDFSRLSAVRRFMFKKLKRRLCLWNFIWLTSMVTKKPKEMRMGKGKGSLAYWSVVASAGSFLFGLTTVFFYIFSLQLFILFSVRFKIGSPLAFFLNFSFVVHLFSRRKLLGLADELIF